MTQEESVPIEELQALVEEWEEKPGLFNPKYITDIMHDTTQNECAKELQAVIEAYE